jgi:GT2 family glycosyltransferase
MAYFAYDRMTPVDVLVGCFIAARREAVEKIGLLDEDFFIYGEDIDWCWRCWEAGWEVTFFPGAEAIHYRGGSSGTVRVKMAVEQQKARLQLWHKHRNRIGQLGIVGLLAFENGVRWVATRLRLLLTSQGAERNREKANLHAACLKALREKPWKTQSRSA